MVLLGLAFGGLMLTFGDLLMKKWSETGGAWIFTNGMLFYFIGLTLLAYSFKTKNIAVASLLIVLFNLITLTIISFFYFKEPLSTKEILGMVLGTITVILME